MLTWLADARQPSPFAYCPSFSRLAVEEPLFQQGWGRVKATHSALKVYLFPVRAAHWTIRPQAVRHFEFKGPHSSVDILTRHRCIYGAADHFDFTPELCFLTASCLERLYCY